MTALPIFTTRCKVEGKNNESDKVQVRVFQSRMPTTCRKLPHTIPKGTLLFPEPLTRTLRLGQ